MACWPSETAIMWHFTVQNGWSVVHDCTTKWFMFGGVINRLQYWTVILVHDCIGGLFAFPVSLYSFHWRLKCSWICFVGYLIANTTRIQGSIYVPFRRSHRSNHYCWHLARFLLLKYCWFCISGFQCCWDGPVCFKWWQCIRQLMFYARTSCNIKVEFDTVKSLTREFFRGLDQSKQALDCLVVRFRSHEALSKAWMER